METGDACIIAFFWCPRNNAFSYPYTDYTNYTDYTPYTRYTTNSGKSREIES